MLNVKEMMTYLKGERENGWSQVEGSSVSCQSYVFCEVWIVYGSLVQLSLSTSAEGERMKYY